MLPASALRSHRAFAETLEARLEAGSRDGPEGTLVVRPRCTGAVRTMTSARWRRHGGRRAPRGGPWPTRSGCACSSRCSRCGTGCPNPPVRPAWITSACSSSPPTPPAWPASRKRGLTLAETAIAELGDADDPAARGADAPPRPCSASRAAAAPDRARRYAGGAAPGPRLRPAPRRDLRPAQPGACRSGASDVEAKQHAEEPASAGQQLGDQELQTEARHVARLHSAPAEATTAWPPCTDARETARRIGSRLLERARLRATITHRARRPRPTTSVRSRPPAKARPGPGSSAWPAYAAPSPACNLAESLTSAGRWDEALETIDAGPRPGPAAAGTLRTARDPRPYRGRPGGTTKRPNGCWASCARCRPACRRRASACSRSPGSKSTASWPGATSRAPWTRGGQP